MSRERREGKRYERGTNADPSEHQSNMSDFRVTCIKKITTFWGVTQGRMALSY